MLCHISLERESHNKASESGEEYICLTTNRVKYMMLLNNNRFSSC